MSTQTKLEVITFCVTLIGGYISKKFKITDNKKIPLQNLAIGLIFALVEYIVTKDFEASIAVSGLLAGGTYDLFHNVSKLKGE